MKPPSEIARLPPLYSRLSLLHPDEAPLELPATILASVGRRSGDFGSEVEGKRGGGFHFDDEGPAKQWDIRD